MFIVYVDYIANLVKSPACNKVSYYFLNTGSAYLFFIMLVSFFTLLYSILCRPWKFNRTLSYLTSQLRFEMLITKTFMLLIEHAFKNPFRGGGWIVTMLPPEYRRCNMQQSTVIVYSISSKASYVSIHKKHNRFMTTKMYINLVKTYSLLLCTMCPVSKEKVIII